MKTIINTVMILIISILSFPVAEAATGDITGQIIEKETMAPVAYAEVTLDNGTTKTIINANEYGHYSAKHLATGKYQVSVKYDNRTVAMNAIHIKDSYTVGINLIVSSNAASVEVKEVNHDNTTGELKSTTDHKFVMPVRSTQAPVKAPMAQHAVEHDLTIIPVNPVLIASKSPLT